MELKGYDRCLITGTMPGLVTDCECVNCRMVHDRVEQGKADKAEIEERLKFWGGEDESQ